MIKKMFNIPVEDASGATTLYIVATILLAGPEWEFEIIKATKERAVVKETNCVWWERYKEFEINPERAVCTSPHQGWAEEGLKTINPKIDFKLTKAMPWGDSYCEALIEFKEDKS
jgi:hypothetical protein